MQELKEIKGTDYMSRSREVINNNFKSVASNFSGQSFPTVNLEASMICFRTDQGAFFMLQEDLKTWKEILRIVDGKVYVPHSSTAENAKKAIGDKNNKDITTYVASVTNSDRTITVVLGNGTKTSFTMPDTTYDVMVGASANKQGEVGLTPAPKAGDNESVLFGDGTWKKFKTAMLDIVHPVGSYYWSSKPTNPATLFGGTWEQVKDKFIYAVGKYSVGATGGSETETLTIAQTPAHTHTRGSMNITGTGPKFNAEIWSPSNTADHNDGAILKGPSYGEARLTGTNDDNRAASYGWNFDASLGWTGETSSVGNNQPHNNMPPYEVAYCWKRIA